MTAINKTNILNKIQANIDALTTATSAKSVFLAALSADTISGDRSITVAAPDNLPDLYTNNLPNGHVIFVNSINLPVVASNCRWLGLDGRVLRDNRYNRVVWTWGCNLSGQLGDNTVVSKSSPVSVVGGFSNWCQVSVSFHTAAIRTTGRLWAWGSNTYGQLGDNTTVSRSSPVSVVGEFCDWCQVSAASHTAAIRTNGTLWTWGRNLYGTLGDNTAVNRSSPVSVVGGFTDWCGVSAGGFHIAAIRTNGTLWTWGFNSNGQLGDNTSGVGTCKSSPVSVVGGFTDWCQVSAGGQMTAAIRTNGTLWSWGSNGYGRLGDNTTVNKSSPVSVVGGFTNWCQVSAGYSHTAAVRTNGTLWTWGLNGCGRLGDNTIVNKSSPVSVVGGFTNWCQVSAGNQHTAAIRTTGSIWTWGFNGKGQLGDNTIVDKSSPVSVVGGFTNWCSVSAKYHTAAINSIR